jgi:hypothetical protein
MKNDLVSLSLTDMPFNNRESIRTSDAIRMIMQTGGTFEYNNTTNLIIGIALLAIGGVIFIGENNYTTVNASIDYLNCTSTDCLLGVQFGVNSNTYKKEFNVDINFIRPTDNNITITYEITNPNNNYMGTSNYNMIMYILIGVGLFFIGLWKYISSGTDDNSSSIEATDSIYKKTETPSGLYVVSKKI